jgi:hypothetical protein
MPGMIQPAPKHRASFERRFVCPYVPLYKIVQIGSAAECHSLSDFFNPELGRWQKIAQSMPYK